MTLLNRRVCCVPRRGGNVSIVTAPGESPVKALSDRGSTPLASTKRENPADTTLAGFFLVFMRILPLITDEEELLAAVRELK